MTLYKWSQTAASDATADSTINWQEGQAPSSINDSARAMMAATAKYRDDISGAIVTSGTSTAYTFPSNQGLISLAAFDKQMIAFTPHLTNAAGGVTVSIDSSTPKPLRASPGVDLLAGTIIQGTPYVATYNNSDGAWYLHGFFGNPYNMPLAGGMDYWGSAVPNSGFAFPVGQAISRATYSALFSIMGTTYGIGDGSTTFNLPDKTGRVSAMLEAVGTRLTTTGVGIDGGKMGSAGGGSQTLALANLPPYQPAGTITNGTITVTNLGQSFIANAVSGGGGGNAGSIAAGSFSASQAASTFAGAAQGGTNTPIKIAQPTIICNYIIRIV